MDEERIGAACLVVGGGAWVVNGLLGLSAPNGTARFYVCEAVWLVVHPLIGAGLVALLRSDSLNGLEGARVGLRIAIVGRLTFFVGEIIAIAVANDEIAALPLAAVLTTVGMTVAGVAVARSPRWRGWARLTPLAMGLYPLIAMFPLLAITGKRPNTAVSAWGLTTIALGVAMLTERPARQADSPIPNQYGDQLAAPVADPTTFSS